MSNSLYIEAINAAEQIKLSAEEKVKQKLIESISPQVKQMIESKLFEEKDVEDTNLETKEESDKDECNMEASDQSKELPESEQEVELNKESREILSKLISQNAKKNAALEKIENLRESLKTLQKAIILSENTGNFSFSKSKVLYLYKNILKEIKNLKSSSIIKSDTDILKEFFKLNKELENMSRRRSNRKYLNESVEDLLEMDLFEADDEDDQPVDLEDDDSDDDLAIGGLDTEEEGNDSPDSEADPKALADELDDIADKIRELGDEMTSPAPAEDDEEDDEEDDAEENAEEDEDLDLAGIFEIDELETEGPNCDVDEDLEDSRVETYSESYRRDQVLEIDENMLRREIGRMKALREGEAKDMAHHFGGGSVEGEAFVDGVELNKLHEMKIKAAKVVRKNRMLESKLSQYKKALQGMKTQLVEMNLFNAKLLYANKLMQNRDLSMKQQRHIVESLDEAKTLGEAKILFESLSKSLVSRQPARTGSNLTEGAIRRRSGSSSAPVRSGQTKPLNESVALDRWATLAGIKK